LQPLEIPQNGQRFVWKSLDENSLDLEKLAEKLGGRLCSAAFTPARRAGLEREPGERGIGAGCHPQSTSWIRRDRRTADEEIFRPAKP
jgi:hypothetical protein